MTQVARWHMASVNAMQRQVRSESDPGSSPAVAGLGVDLDAPQFHSEATSA